MSAGKPTESLWKLGFASPEIRDRIMSSLAFSGSTDTVLAVFIATVSGGELNVVAQNKNSAPLPSTIQLGGRAAVRSEMQSSWPIEQTSLRASSFADANLCLTPLYGPDGQVIASLGGIFAGGFRPSDQLAILRSRARVVGLVLAVSGGGSAAIPSLTGTETWSDTVVPLLKTSNGCGMSVVVSALRLLNWSEVQQTAGGNEAILLYNRIGMRLRAIRQAEMEVVTRIAPDTYYVFSPCSDPEEFTEQMLELVELCQADKACSRLGVQPAVTAVSVVFERAHEISDMPRSDFLALFNRYVHANAAPARSIMLVHRIHARSGDPDVDAELRMDSDSTKNFRLS